MTNKEIKQKLTKSRKDWLAREGSLMERIEIEVKWKDFLCQLRRKGGLN